jgi:hypothetical protein
VVTKCADAGGIDASRDHSHAGGSEALRLDRNSRPFVSKVVNVRFRLIADMSALRQRRYMSIRHKTSVRLTTLALMMLGSGCVSQNIANPTTQDIVRLFSSVGWRARWTLSISEAATQRLLC